eukprot:Hpha_TRINITY_DN2657_c0_g1::TRINITY_DN2657_c0_g1_i1::g.145751::m.145751
MFLNVTGDPTIMSQIKTDGRGDVIWTVDPNKQLGMPQQVANLTRSLGIDHLPGPLFSGYLVLHRTSGRGAPAEAALNMGSSPAALGLRGGSWVYVRQLRPLPPPGPPAAEAGVGRFLTPDNASFPGVERTESHDSRDNQSLSRSQLQRLNLLAAKLGHLSDERIRRLLAVNPDEGGCPHCGRGEDEYTTYGTGLEAQLPRGHATPAEAKEAAVLGESLYDDDYADDGFGPPSRGTTDSWAGGRPRGGAEGGGFRRDSRRERDAETYRSSGGRTRTRFWSSFVGEWTKQMDGIGVDPLARGLCHSALARLARRQDENLRRYDTLSELMQISSRQQQDHTDPWSFPGAR